MIKIKLRIKINFREIVIKEKRYKAEISEKDNQMVEVLLRNWNHKSKAKGDKSVESNWLIYPKKVWSKDIVYKTYWGSGSHLQIKSTIKNTKKIYWWDKMDKNVRKMYFNCEICTRRAKIKEKMAYKIYWILLSK